MIIRIDAERRVCYENRIVDYRRDIIEGSVRFWRITCATIKFTYNDSVWGDIQGSCAEYGGCGRAASSTSLLVRCV